MRIKKEVARPGETWYTTPDGQPRLLTVLPDDTPFDGHKVGIKYWHKEGQDMLADGLTIPVPLEHQKLGAMTHAEKMATDLTHNAGSVASYEMDGDRLMATFDLADHKVDPKDLGKTIKWTSPWVNTFTDGHGKHRIGVISHVALTTRPRMVHQEPFPSIAASLNAAKKTKAVPASSGFAISRAGLLKDGLPAYPIAFSLYSGIALASDEFPKKEKGPKGDESEEKTPPKPDKGEGDEPKAKKPFGGEGDKGDEEGGDEGNKPDMGGDVPHKFDPQTGEAIEQALVDPDGDIPVFEIICDLFEMLDPPITIGENCTAENFPEMVYKALMETLKANKATPPPETPMPDQTQTPTPEKPKANPVVEQQAPLYMSLEQRQAALGLIQDGKLRELLSAQFSLQEQSAKTAEALKKKAFADARSRRDERTAAIAKNLPSQKDRDEFLALVGGMAFSLGEDGVVKDESRPWLDLMEKQIKELPAMLQNPGAVFAQPQPREYDGTMTGERRKAVADELAQAGGLK